MVFGSLKRTAANGSSRMILCRNFFFGQVSLQCCSIYENIRLVLHKIGTVSAPVLEERLKGTFGIIKAEGLGDVMFGPVIITTSKRVGVMGL